MINKKVDNIERKFTFIEWNHLEDTLIGATSVERFKSALRNLLVRAEISKLITTIGMSPSCGDKRCKCCRHMQHSSSYTSKVTGKQYTIFCTVNCKSANVIYILVCSVCGLQYVGESKQPFHKRLNGHRSDLTKKNNFFLWASTSDCLTTVSRISTEWKSSSLNRTVCGVIFNVRIGKDFGLKKFVFYIRTVLTENNRFLCIFSFTVVIINEYFTTVTKSRICAHHLLLTIILSILKCVAQLYHPIFTVKWGSSRFLIRHTLSPDYSVSGNYTI